MKEYIESVHQAAQALNEAILQAELAGVETHLTTSESFVEGEFIHVAMVAAFERPPASDKKPNPTRACR